MEGADFLQTISGLGVGGILAAVFYNENVKISRNYAERLAALLDQERGRTDMLINLVRDVTVAITKNTAVTESFHVRLDKENGGRQP